jgi:hypothetical protein
MPKERLSKLVEPTTLQQPSTTIDFAWIMAGWYSKMAAPARSSGPKRRRLERWVSRWSVCRPGVMIFTSTPRAMARTSSVRALASGRK